MTPNPSPLLNLPPELLNRIYEFVMMPNEAISPNGSGQLRDAGKLTPGLLRVNKTIYGHFRPIFYGNQCFDFTYTDAEGAATFLNTIGVTNAGYIRHVIINILRVDGISRNALRERERIVEEIKRRCVNLATIKNLDDYFSHLSHNYREKMAHVEKIKQSLRTMDFILKDNALLQNSTLLIEDEGQMGVVMGQMTKNFGWTNGKYGYADAPFGLKIDMKGLIHTIID